MTPTTTTTTTGPTSFSETVCGHLARVETDNAVALTDATELLMACVRSGGMIYAAGAGHSLAAVAETFYRAGGLACVRPLYHPNLLPLHGVRASTNAERRTGLAAELLGQSGFSELDILIVFSTSGVNPYPVELAAAARQVTTSGRPVIGVTSLAASAAAPRRASSTLAELSSVVLDTQVPPGDACYPEQAPVTAALSTIVAAFVWNLLLTRLYDSATAAGFALPLWRSANVTGGDEANSSLLARYARRAPALR